MDTMDTIFGPVLTVVVVVGVFGPMAYRAFNRQKLRETGTRARGVITALRETMTTVNDQPECILDITVHPEGKPPFQATTRRVIGPVQILQFAPGSEVTVAFDPKDPTKVEITALGYLAVNEAEAIRMVEEFAQLQKELNASGVPAEAIVTSFERTGVTVRGDNPLATLGLKILPVGEAPFDAKLVAVFQPSGLPKYQPGRQVHVRFDARDRQRVTFDMSRTDH